MAPATDIESKVLALTVLVVDDWLECIIIYENAKGVQEIRNVRRALPVQCVCAELLCWTRAEGD